LTLRAYKYYDPLNGLWQKNFISSNIKTGEKVMKYVCDACGWVYDEATGDPDNGISPGTKWEDLPKDFSCPLCSEGKGQFYQVK